MPKISKMKSCFLAVTIYIMEASHIRTRMRKLNKKWQTGHPWSYMLPKKNMVLRYCIEFFGKGRRIFLVEWKFTVWVDFESYMPKWQGLSKFSFQHCKNLDFPGSRGFYEKSLVQHMLQVLNILVLIRVFLFYLINNIIFLLLHL